MVAVWVDWLVAVSVVERVVQWGVMTAVVMDA